MGVNILADHAVSLFAYIGPGADLGLISSVIGLALTVGASGLFIVLYPVRSLLRRLRGQPKASDDVSSAG
jgi:hypothetical protein